MFGKRSQFLIDLSLVSGVLLILSLGEWLGLTQSLVATLENFFQPTVIKVSQVTNKVNQPWLSFKKNFHSARRVQELEVEYTNSLARISELEYLEKENQELRQLLDTQEKSAPLVIAAPIISQGQPSISAGEAAGIRLGQPVLVAKMLVGLIQSTSTHQANVSLLFQNQTQPVLVKTEGGVEGMVVGDGKNILLTEIPKEAELKVGEKVVTLGQEKIRPQIFVGLVQQIIDQPAAPIKQAIINQETSFYEASVVEVLP